MNEIILETVFGITIVLFILGLCFLMIYWGLTNIYKRSKLNGTHEEEMKREIESLKGRVEFLEKKIAQK